MPFTQSNSDSRDCGPFFIDVVGRYSRPQLAMSASSELRRQDSDVERLIELTWQEKLLQAQLSGARLYDGRLARLVSYEPSEKQFELSVAPVSYREFVGTNLANPRLRYSHGPEVLANPLGVSAAVVSRDGFVLLGRRSNRVAYHPGRLHPFGGMIEMDEAGQATHPFDAIRDELIEELAAAPQAIGQTLCLGLVRDKQIVQPELIFEVAVHEDASALRQAIAHAKDAYEHTEVVAVRSEQSSLVNFVQREYAALTPVGVATLMMHGLHHWGSGWFTAARGYLHKVI